ncbi:MAG: NUDIX hydrolase [Candidatus Omnitrophica bacterium]|nr:NUDIX hydrolase [Candidatus Omnitrophota bacterium]
MPAAACLAVNKQKEILLVKRGIEPYKGEWSLPGGFMEMNESPEKAAERELKEETGIKGVASDIVGVIVHPSKIYGSILVVGVMFKVIKGTPRPGSDAMETAFYGLNDLPPIPIRTHSELLKRFVEQFKS